MSSNNHPSQPSLQSSPSSMAHRSQSTPFPPGSGTDTESSIVQRPPPGQPGQQYPSNPCPCLVYPSQKCCPLCCSPVGQQGAVFHSPFCPCVRARQHPIPYGQQPGSQYQYPPLAGGQQPPPMMANNPGQYSYQSPQIGAGYPQPSNYNQQSPYQYPNSNSNGRPMTAPAAPGSGSGPSYPPLQGPPNSRDADLHAPVTRYWLEQNLPHYMKQMELQGIFRSCYCHTNPGPPELRDQPSDTSTASSALPDSDSQSSLASSMVAQPSSSQHHPSSVASSHGGYGGQHGQGHPSSQNPSIAGSPSMAPTPSGTSMLSSAQNPPSGPNNKDISSKGVIVENTPISGDLEDHQEHRNRHSHYPSRHRTPSMDSSNLSSMGDPSISSSNMSSSTNRDPSISSSVSGNPSGYSTSTYRDPSISSSVSGNPSGYSTSTYRDPSMSSSVSSSIAPSQTGTGQTSMSSMGSSMAPTNYDPSVAPSSNLGNPSSISVAQNYPRGGPVEMKCFPHQTDPNALICYPTQSGPAPPGPPPPPPGMNFFCYPQPQQSQYQQQSSQGQGQGSQVVQNPSVSMSVATSHGGRHGYHGQGHPSGY